jgi:hypothetical protein
MRFGPLPEAIKSRQYQSLFRAQNLTYSGTATTGDTIRIDTPSLPATYLSNLDSFLTLTLTNNSTTNVPAATSVTLECMGAHALINRIQIFCGGVLLQDLQGYNVLLQYLYDFSVTPGEQVSTFNASAGAPSDITAPRVPGTTLTGGASRTVCLPLHCLLGTAASRYIPMSAPFTILITLETATRAFVTTNSTDIPAYTVSGCSYVAHLLELDPAVDALVKSSTGGGPLSVPISDFRLYTATQPAQTSSNTILISARFSSIKTLILLPYLNSVVTANNRASISNRCKNYLTEVALRIGATTYPQHGKANTVALMWAETLKSRHMLGIQGDGCLLNYAGYISEVPTGGGHFCLGWDLDVLTGKSDSILSGLNSLGSNGCFVDLTFDAANVSNIAAATYYSYAEFNNLVSWVAPDQVTISI